MSTKFNTTQNAPSRSNANRSPNKQPKAFPRNGKWPNDFGQQRLGIFQKEWVALQLRNHGFIKYGA